MSVYTHRREKPPKPVPQFLYQPPIPILAVGRRMALAHASLTKASWGNANRLCDAILSGMVFFVALGMCSNPNFQAGPSILSVKREGLKVDLYRCP